MFYVQPLLQIDITLCELSVKLCSCSILAVNHLCWKEIGQSFASFAFAAFLPWRVLCVLLYVLTIVMKHYYTS